MNKVLRVPDYLGHILQAIERIARYTAKTLHRQIHALTAQSEE